MIDDIKKDAETRMQKSVDALKHELQRLRTGRASTALVEHLKVHYYGIRRAAVAGRQRRRDRRALAHHHAVGEEHGRRGREGDPRLRPRPAPRTPRAVVIRINLPRADRAAPQGAGQARRTTRARTPRSRSATCAATRCSRSRTCSRTRRSPRTRSARAEEDIQKLTDKLRQGRRRRRPGQGRRADGDLSRPDSARCAMRTVQRPRPPPTDCRAMSPSSWTATAAGPSARQRPRTLRPSRRRQGGARRRRELPAPAASRP